VKPSDLRNDLWCRKTRMLGLSDGERISMIRSAVLTQYTRVTDRRMDGRTDGIGAAYTRYSIYAVARKNCKLGHDCRRVCSHRRRDSFVASASAVCIGHNRLLIDSVRSL